MTENTYATVTVNTLAEWQAAIDGMKMNERINVNPNCRLGKYFRQIHIEDTFDISSGNGDVYTWSMTYAAGYAHGYAFPLASNSNFVKGFKTDKGMRRNLFRYCKWMFKS